jgi:hypothetical protein
VGTALQSPPADDTNDTDDTTPDGRLAHAFMRVPPRVRLLIGFVLLFVVAFSAALLPLLTQNGILRAEVAGALPSTAVVGQPATADLGIDNTGDKIVKPLCIAASFDLSVDVTSVTFQGLDTVPFRDGRACGGELTGQETASVRFVFVPKQAGTLHALFVAAQGGKDIGPAITRSVEVTAP